MTTAQHAASVTAPTMMIPPMLEITMLDVLSAMQALKESGDAESKLDSIRKKIMERTPGNIVLLTDVSKMRVEAIDAGMLSKPKGSYCHFLTEEGEAWLQQELTKAATATTSIN